MKIALDFDETFTLDPTMWLYFIDEAVTAGHTVYIVTARDEFNDGINWLKVGLGEAPCEVIWCDGCPKRELTRGLGLKIDVWIDDNPAGIILPTSFTHEDQLAAWRHTDKYRGSKLPITGASRGFEHAADRRKDAQEPADLHGRPGLFSRRLSGGGGGVADRERSA